jgi:hypothetical protein
MKTLSDYYYEQLAESVVRIMKFNSINEEEMARHMMDYFENTDTKGICYLAIQFMLDASKETKKEIYYWHRVRNQIEKL